MPIVLIERLPLPRLRTYLTVSFGLFACALYYSHHHVTAIDSIGIAIDSANVVQSADPDVVDLGEKRRIPLESESDFTNAAPRFSGNYIYDVFSVLREETWCIWIMINMAYCTLILFGKLIQKVVFGKLRVSEQQHLKDKFWNFLFYKFIFVVGVMNIQSMDQVLLWCSWFSALGFLHLLSLLCKDRFEYLSFSPTTTPWVHAKVVVLLLAIQAACSSLIALSVFVGYFYVGFNVFAFMVAECFILIIKTFYVLVRYAIHLWDVNHEGVWENRAMYVYYAELIFELAAVIIDFSHHLHMLVWGHIFLSMASLVIFMQLRYLFHEIQRRLKRHKNYLRVIVSMEARFTMATQKQLEENNDDCAICWERMDMARRLPCGHLFHNACLRSWLEQDTSCPTCRTSLDDPNNRPPTAAAPSVEQQNNNAPEAAPAPAPINQMTNHFFHFDASRYVSWLPSFSVELMTHTELGHILGGTGGPGRHPLTQIPSSQLDNMARQVLDVFPAMPLATLVDDLRLTRSVELTIENIIEGRLPQRPLGFTATSQAPLATSSEPAAGSEMTTGGSTVLPPLATSAQPLPSLSGAPTRPSAVPDSAVRDATPQEDSMSRSGAGCRFSKSSMERETMLSSRKDHLLQLARRRYLNKQKSHETVTASDASQSADADVASDRQGALAYDYLRGEAGGAMSDGELRARHFDSSSQQRREN